MNDFPETKKESLSIFWVETDKIRPNSMQPRREFDEEKLHGLSESIRQYGILQPLVVIRCEREVPTGTEVDYELIAGERRLRASKLAGLTQIPVIIRREPAQRIKLELALIENVQREDLNPIERGIAFKQLIDNFGLKQREVGEKINKSREFVANSVRLLSLPEYMQQALVAGSINEGHTRPLLMLSDKPGDQKALFDDIVFKKLKVRDAESISRRIAHDRARKQERFSDQGTRSLEEQIEAVLGTRVSIERKGLGGTISISFFSDEELQELSSKIAKEEDKSASSMNSLPSVSEKISSHNILDNIEPDARPDTGVTKESISMPEDFELGAEVHTVSSEEAISNEDKLSFTSTPESDVEKNKDLSEVEMDAIDRFVV